MRVDTADIYLISAYIVVVLVGIAGNSLVIEVVRRKRSMHSTMNFLLVNLAISDLLTLVFCLPGTTLSYTEQPNGHVGNFLCKFITTHTIAGVGMIVSGMTLTLISVERYKALVIPMETRFRLNRGNVLFAIIGIWIFAIAYVCPLFIFETYSEKYHRCITSWPTSSAKNNAYWIVLAVIVTTAFVIMFVCYFSIVRGLYFTNTICSSNANAGVDNDAVLKRKIVQMLLIVTAVFLLCFFPFAIATAADIAQGSVFYKTSYFLVYCSSSLNPITYALNSTNYRTAFKEVLNEFRFCACLGQTQDFRVVVQ
ncbi:neuropeptide FF receptor 2-like [Stylophora pistillata]|uniref:neuropeptide FF receptor 2-like n=1 Tax=Stylophora pistillata TaxID=50429 RepID=UPI000C057AAE|nr:neuropeptide FF receptor 2-like [Stylophora pistillata]XP_022804418.1 neuropeptide FF receptor 2-like [Stylophora pistillata]